MVENFSLENLRFANELWIFIVPSVLMAFELFVAFLQAYIFSVFAGVYISEACERSNH